MKEEAQKPITMESIVRGELFALDFGQTPPDKVPLDYQSLHQHYLARLKEAVEELPEITDRASYDQNQKTRTWLVGIRTGLDKRRKDLFAPLRKLKEQVDSYIGTSKESGLQADIAALEAHIQAKQRVWDDLQEEKRREAQRLIEERNASRARQLLDLGMEFNGSHYNLGGLSKRHGEMCTDSDEAFAAFLEELRPVAEKVREETELVARREGVLRSIGMQQDPTTGHWIIGEDNETVWVTPEQLSTMDDETFRLLDISATKLANARYERKRREEEEAIRQQEEFARQQEEAKRIADESAELDRRKAEFEQQVRDVRLGELIAAGCELVNGDGGDQLVILNPYTEDRLVVARLHALDQKDMDGHLADAKEAWAKYNAIEARREARIAQLEALGLEPDGEGMWSHGEVSATDYMLRQSSDERWEATLAEFSDSVAKASAQDSEAGWFAREDALAKDATWSVNNALMAAIKGRSETDSGYAGPVYAEMIVLLEQAAQEAAKLEGAIASHRNVTAE